MENLEHLIPELLKLPQETEWVEFKKDNADPDEIGEYISALSNSATYPPIGYQKNRVAYYL